MTKKDFEALARAMCASRPRDIDWTPIGTLPMVEQQFNAMLQWKHDLAAIIEVCKASNPRFDPEQFKAACLRAK